MKVSYSKLGTPFKTVVNETLRAGLDKVELPAKQRRYKTKPHAMGLRQGRNLDNIQELLAQVEMDKPSRLTNLDCYRGL